MIKTKTVNKYTTSDGMVFDYRVEAEGHEAALSREKYRGAFIDSLDRTERGAKRLAGVLLAYDKFVGEMHFNFTEPVEVTAQVDEPVENA